jgi:two-component system OmpR family response regulator
MSANGRRRVAIVEDDAALGENYRDAFTREGYDVSLYDNRAAALAAFDRALPDLVMIDVNLGDDIEGGFELCRTLRARSAKLPLIFLTARDSEFDAVSGLRLGADDYLTKDISLAHLLARVAALFRRQAALREPAGGRPATITRGSLTLEENTFSVRWDGQLIPLTLTEYWLVHALARHPGHVKNRQQLMEAASTVLDDNTITSHIKRIRRKFQHADPDFDAIETIYGMGYRWRPA